MPTTVEPAEFRFVEFDASAIAALVDELAGKVGLADVPIVIEVDETSALGHTDLTSIDPVRIRTESGALEDPKRLRRFSESHATDVLGRFLQRAADRRDPSFAGAPDDDELPMAHRVAWDVYTVGRIARHGYPVARQRWLYAFRNRHGFTDAADAAFEALWGGEDLSFTELTALSDETAAQNPGPLER